MSFHDWLSWIDLNDWLPLKKFFVVELNDWLVDLQLGYPVDVAECVPGQAGQVVVVQAQDLQATQPCEK